MLTKFRHVAQSINQSAQSLAEVHKVLNDHLAFVNQKLDVVLEYQRSQTTTNQSLAEAHEKLNDHLAFVNQKLDVVLEYQKAQATSKNGDDTQVQRPVLIAEKTYDTTHPGYDPTIVRNYPGKIFNYDTTCTNTVFNEIRKFASDATVPDEVWTQLLEDVLEEVSAIPHAQQIFERRTYIEWYMDQLKQRYKSTYNSGWVSTNAALFLYWLVRRLNPKVIVQTGVSNGLSSAFMILALVKNGSAGKLHAIDLPHIFNANDSAWTESSRIYGVCIPEGKASGWMIPDAYRDHFELWQGDAKQLLPKVVDKLSSIDMFYHDSDHTYNHMMFEFNEVSRHLHPGSLMVADDISWNSSMWDFADKHNVPSYNFKGDVGVAFF